MKRLSDPIKICFVLVFLFIVLNGCGGKASRLSEEESGASRKRIPDYIIHDVTHYYYEGGIKKTEIIFDEGDYYSDEEKLYVENCSFIYYDIDGEINSRGRSERAIVLNNGSIILAEENVVITSETNGAVLETEYLEWHGGQEQFITDRFVTITRTNGDTISGIGLLSDVALRFITIHKNVKGSFEE